MKTNSREDISTWLWGRHPVHQALRAGRRRVHVLNLLKGKEKEYEETRRVAEAHGVSVRVQPDSFFKKFPPEIHHQGIALEAEGYPFADFSLLRKESFLLALDEIQDPQNVGALCRSAYLFGVGGILLPESRSAGITPGTCQASVGAVEHLNIAKISSLAQVLESLKQDGFWIYGADHGATRNVQEENYPDRVVVVIGSEERGLRRLVKEKCDVLIRVPTVPGKVDSLNASVAGGVILYEIRRQRMQKTG